MLKFYTPSQLAQYSPPDNAYLVGKHFIRGAVTVLTGAPGVGKSFAARDLAVAGALGGNWFGLKVHEQFKTMIFQGENQLIRLCLLYTSPSPRDQRGSRMPSSA